MCFMHNTMFNFVSKFTSRIAKTYIKAVYIDFYKNIVLVSTLKPLSYSLKINDIEK